MPVFYDHGPTRVTDRWLTVGDQRFAIGQLSNLRTTRVAVGRLRWWRADHLLLGEYNGRTTWLYQSRDKVEFGKLSRAVARARSYHADRTPLPREIIAA
jgi:hypothetical protein